MYNSVFSNSQHINLYSYGIHINIRLFIQQVPNGTKLSRFNHLK